MRRISGLIFVLSCLGVLCLIAPVQADAARVEVKQKKGLFDVQAKEVPLGEVLKVLCEQAKIQLEGDTAFDETVSLGLESEAIDQVFNRLLRNHSYVLLYEKVGKNGVRPTLLRIVRGGGISGSRAPGATSFSGSGTPTTPSSVAGRDPRGVSQQRTEAARGRGTKVVARPGATEASSSPPTEHGPKRLDAARLEQVLSSGDSVLAQISTGPTAAMSPMGGGFLITAVSDPSIFSELGLEAGDIVTNVNGNPVVTAKDLVQELQTAAKDPTRPTARIERIRKSGMMDPIYMEIQKVSLGS